MLLWQAAQLFSGRAATKNRQFAKLHIYVINSYNIFIFKIIKLSYLILRQSGKLTSCNTYIRQRNISIETLTRLPGPKLLFRQLKLI